MCEIFPHSNQFSYSWAPAGCPIIQSNWDTNYVELAQPPEIKHSVPPDFQRPVASPRLLLVLLWPSMNQQFHDPCLRFDNSLSWLIKSGMCFITIYYQFIMKKEPEGKMHRTRYGNRVWRVHALSRHATLSVPTCVHQLKLSEPHC